MKTDTNLYDRGMSTLLASFEDYARGAKDAALQRCPGVDVAVFPHGSEREFYNNAVLNGGLGTIACGEAVDAVEAAYATAGVTRYAVWVRETDPRSAWALERRGYTLDTTTRAMGMSLDEIRLPRTRVDFALPDWSEYARIMGLGSNYLSESDHDRQRILIACDGGVNAAAAMAFDDERDCGIYNVGTLEGHRRRGLGTALTLAHLYDARDRGCRTASLQSTEMAEGVYAAAGFSDLGRILEFVPPVSPARREW